MCWKQSSIQWAAVGADNSHVDADDISAANWSAHEKIKNKRKKQLLGAEDPECKDIH